MTRVQTSDTASPRARSILKRSASPANHLFRTAFETVGPADAPAVVVLGGISASRHVTATEIDPRTAGGRSLSDRRKSSIQIAFA